MSMIWTPAMDPACELWIDPADDDAVLLDANGRVERIDDKSGFGHNAVQGDGAHRPIRALRHLELMGGEHVDIPGLVMSGSGYLVALVASVRSGTVDSARLLSGMAAGSLDYAEGGFRLMTYSSPPYLTIRSSSPGPARLAEFDDAFVITGAFHSDTVWVYLNGDGSSMAAATAFNTTAGIRVGCRIQSLGYHWRGSVGDIIVTSDDSDANRERLEGYLGHKWGGAAKLPTSHPYRASPPAATGSAALSGTVALSARHVVHFRAASGECLSSVQPDPVTGAWATILPQTDDVYMALTGDASCAPLIDGPYDLTGG